MNTKLDECEIVTVKRQLTAVVKVLVPMNKIPEAERAARTKINAALPTLGAGAEGLSFTLWRPPSEGILDMEPGIIVSRVFRTSGDVELSTLPSGSAARYRLVGPFDEIPGAWRTLFDWCARKELNLAGINWQVYGDRSHDPAKQETSLYALLT